MNIQLQFALTPDDFYEFHRGYMKHRRSLTPGGQRGLRFARLIIWLVVVLLMIALYLVTGWLSPSSPPPPAGPAAPPAPDPIMALVRVLLPFVIFFWVIWGFFMWMTRSRFMLRRLAAGGIRVDQLKSVELTDAQITIRQSHSYSVMEWAHYIRFIETPNTFLLFELPRLAQILPKRAFRSPEDIDTFRRFAQAHVGNQPMGFPVQPLPSAPPMPPGPQGG